MTRNGTIRECTAAILANTVINDINDIYEIEEKLIYAVNQEFDVHNAICDKDKKWTPVKVLYPYQIADIMNHVFTIKKIYDSQQDKETIGIYIDDILAKYLNDEDSKGIYLTSNDVLFKVAKMFDYSLSRTAFSEILSLLRTSTVRVNAYTGKEFVALKDGILNKETNQMLPFDKETVFLSKMSDDTKIP